MNVLQRILVSCVTPRGGGGGTLIFSYIRRLLSFFGVQTFEFQYLFFFFGGGRGGSEK